VSGRSVGRGHGAADRDPRLGRAAHERRCRRLARGQAAGAVGEFESFAQPEIARLDELRVAALEGRIDARLADGEHALAVAELEQLAAEHPSRERLIGLLMLALYRSGRQTDALEVYTRGRQRLDEQLGLEPSPELQRLQEGILRHDPALRGPTTTAAREAVAPCTRDPADRPRARARRGDRPGMRGRHAARDPGRTRRRRQDAIGARGGAARRSAAQTLRDRDGPCNQPRGA